ncbi:MAG: lpdA [Chitinophagaceae bacterium]|nr:lpdA [Chitinophagaceae bacterium]
MERFDVCIIGGGPAGYAAAMRALDFNKKVVLIEKNKLGGAGLYNGALSSKTFWELSKDISSVRKRMLQYHTGQTFDVSFKQILNEVREGIGIRKFQLEEQVFLLHEKKQGHFMYLHGTAKLLNANEVEIVSEQGLETVYADHIVVATGSRPRKLPHLPIDEKIVVTSDGIESFEEFPKSMVVLGAGVIGCEWATIFSNFGYTNVFIIDKADRILPFEDYDVADSISKNMSKQGIVIHNNAQLAAMKIVDGEVEYELEYKDGRKEIHRVEKALVSIGRIPNVENLGLENAGVIIENGCIKNKDGQTNIPNIYAIGDLTADVALVNVAEVEGRHVIEKMFGNKTSSLLLNNISTIMFLNPEVAGVGINEMQAQKKGLRYRVASMSYDLIPRAIAMRVNNGFFKILVTDDDDMKILGMRAVGVHASSAIQAVALLISMDKGIEELAELIHPHPSIIEGIQECVRMLLKKSILKPELFKGRLNCKVCDEFGCTQDIYFV